MGTAPEGPVEVKGVVARAGDRFVILTEEATGIVYGDRTHKHPVWPLLLICAAAVGMALDVFVVGFVALILLAIWIGAHR